MNPRFIPINGEHEYLDDAAPEFTRFRRWLGSCNQPDDTGSILFAQERCRLIYGDEPRHVELHPGQFASVTGPLTIVGGKGIMLTMRAYRPPFMLGGPIEAKGRLKYIDGCTDSLLLSPVKLGNPCFNALYFPPGINQTQHTHPSLRAGLVVSGRGECITPQGRIPLEADLAFVIETNGVHSFRTFADSGMVVVAYHPDSDFGPRDEDHPMINRTIVDGVSAALIEQIRTQ